MSIAKILEIKQTLVKTGGDNQNIPLGGWRNFFVKVVDPNGAPVAGAKVAWRTPAGGVLTYVAETAASGIASATNLYTFGVAGIYKQTATLVGRDAKVGFSKSGDVKAEGQTLEFSFTQQ